MFFPTAGVEVNPLLLILIGFTVGVCGGFFGVGGAFMVTPALNIFGFPMAYAIGTDMAHVMGKSIVATLKHHVMGNVDFRLGGLMVLGTLPGVEMGKRLVMHLESQGLVESTVRMVYIVVLGGIGLYMLWEGRRSKRAGDQHDERPTPLALRLRRINLPPMVSLPRSRIPRISLWVIVGIGFATGLAAGFLGVGGGFIRMPALMYLLGVPTLVAIGTDLFEIIISGGYGAFTYALAGRVDIMAALVMLLGAAVGAEVGTVATRYVDGSRIRILFSLTMFAAAVSVILKQTSASLDLDSLKTAANVLLLGAAIAMSMTIVVSAVKGSRRSLRERLLAEAERAR